MAKNDRQRRSRSTAPNPGVTLMELLVVIGILMLLMAVALPSVGPMMDGRRARETARAINVYFSSARSVALETGRPCGVVIRRMEGEPLRSMLLEQVEVPPPYAGDTMNSRAMVQLTGHNGQVATVTANMDGGFDPQMVRQGDLVQFNHQGPLYTITGPGSTLTLQVDVRQGQMLPWPEGTPSAPVPYEVLRQPVKSFANPLQLPASAVIDLEYSGTDVHDLGDESGDIYLIFSSNGSLQRVYHGGETHPGLDPIFLLVGKRAQKDKENYQDMNSLWVTLNPRSGLITTNQMGVSLDNTDGIPGSLNESREFAREAQSMGGR